MSEEYKDCIIALKHGKGVRLEATGLSFETKDKTVVVWDKSGIMAIVPFDEIRCVLFTHGYDPDALLEAIGCVSIDPSCRNHGSCLWCEENRKFKFRDKEKDYRGRLQTEDD